MELKGLVEDLVSTAVSILGDMAEVTTYSSIVTGAYDPATDVVATTSTSRAFNSVFARFSFDEVKGDKEIIVDTDAKLVVSAKDFGTGEPAKNDELTVKSKVWNVVKVKGVPGDSVWIIHIRRT